MKAHTASLINAMALILLSLWGGVSSATSSPTALIPTLVGVALIGCYSGVKTQNKMIAHMAVVLTLLVFLVLFMPFTAALGRGDTLAVVRIALMLLSTAFALFFFVKSFIDTRKQNG